MSPRQVRRIMRCAGFTRAQRRDFFAAWDTDAAELTCYQARLIMAFYAAAGVDEDDLASNAILATISAHAELLEIDEGAA